MEKLFKTMSKKEFIRFSPQSVFLPVGQKAQLKERKGREILVDKKSGKIVKIGSAGEINNFLRGLENPFKVVQEGGGVILPGFIDAHNHLIHGVLPAMGAVSIAEAKNKQELLHLIRQNLNWEYSEPQLFLGHNEVSIPDVWKKDLDEVAPDRPICLVDVGYHSVRVNTPMLELVKEKIIKEEKYNYRVTGSIDEEGGRLTEGHAILSVQAAELAGDVEDIAYGIIEQLEKWLRQGVVAVFELHSFSLMEIKALFMARRIWEKEKNTKFPVRRIFTSPITLKKFLERQKMMRSFGFNRRKDWEMFGLKMFADGTFEIHTAMMKQVYQDQKTKGEEFYNWQELQDGLELAAKNGIAQVAVHAIGDAGAERVVQVAEMWKKISRKYGLKGNKFRVEHFQLPLNVLNKTKTLGIWVNSEPNFETDFARSELLGSRVHKLCPHAAVLEKHIPMHFGSDGMPTSPLLGIWCATHHPVKKFSITLEQAVAAYSVMGAEYLEDKERGRLAEGAYADLVVLKPLVVEYLRNGRLIPNEYDKLENDYEYFSNKVRLLEAGISKVFYQGKRMR